MAKAQRGTSSQAIGRSKGGMTTRILALTDALGNLVRFRRVPGNRFDSIGVAPLIKGAEFGALLADKAFDNNDIIADRNERGAKIVISQHPRRAIPIPLDTLRPTAYRIVAALVAEGLLTETRSGRLRLGPRLVGLAAHSLEQSDLRGAARKPTEKSRDSLDETIHLAVNSGDEMIYIDKLEPQRVVQMSSRIGTRAPLHSSSVGKVWLASLPYADAVKIIAGLAFPSRTIHTITSASALLTQFAEIRQRGFATDLEENELEICCYGMAIRTEGGSTVGCVSVSVPYYRFKELPQTESLKRIRECVDEIAWGLNQGVC